MSVSSIPPSIAVTINYGPTSPVPVTPNNTPSEILNTPQASAASEDKAQKYATEFDIPYIYQQHFGKFREWKPVIMLDNSGSMSDLAHPNDWKSPTRWQEAHDSLNDAVGALLCFHDATQLYLFDNPLRAKRGIVEPQIIRSVEDLQPIFAQEPNVGTPLLTRLKQVITEQPVEERKVMILIVTDGQPSDCSLEELNAFLKGLHAKGSCYKDRLAINFIMCTDDKRVLAFYNDAIDGVPLTEVTDDYAAERAEVLSKNPGINFSKQAYAVRQLLFMHKEMDDADTRRVNVTRYGEIAIAVPADDTSLPQGCCIIS